MVRDGLIRVGWELLKSEFSIKRLKMMYTQIGNAYQVYAVSLNYGLWALIVSANEVADFEANYKADALSVGSGDEATALVQIPLESRSPVSSNDSGRSFGYVATSSAVAAPIRASAYAAPGSDGMRSVRSSDPSDTLSGTGARKIKITYLDEAMNGPFTETVDLGGTTAVDTIASDIAFIEKMEVVEVGAGGSNAGDIELLSSPAGGGTVVGSINPGDNQTYWAHHYVPVNKKCGIVEFGGSSSVTPGAVTPARIDPLNALLPKQALDIALRHGAVDVHRPRSVLILVDGPALITLDEQADSSTPSTAYAVFSWIQF